MSEDNNFYLRDGGVLSNLKDLKDELKKNIGGFDVDNFEHHVTSDRNDYANWVRHVFEDGSLADKLEKCFSPVDMLKVLDAKLSKKQIKSKSVVKAPNKPDLPVKKIMGSVVKKPVSKVSSKNVVEKKPIKTSKPKTVSKKKSVKKSNKSVVKAPNKPDLPVKKIMGSVVKKPVSKVSSKNVVEKKPIKTSKPKTVSKKKSVKQSNKTKNAKISTSENIKKKKTKISAKPKKESKPRNFNVPKKKSTKKSISLSVDTNLLNEKIEMCKELSTLGLLKESMLLYNDLRNQFSGLELSSSEKSSFKKKIKDLYILIKSKI